MYSGLYGSGAPGGHVSRKKLREDRFSTGDHLLLLRGRLEVERDKYIQTVFTIFFNAVLYYDDDFQEPQLVCLAVTLHKSSTYLIVFYLMTCLDLVVLAIYVVLRLTNVRMRRRR